MIDYLISLREPNKKLLIQMSSAENHINKRLNKRISENSLRKLGLHVDLIDFCSNDYLGFSHNQGLKELVSRYLVEYDIFLNGSTGSRLISGNYEITENTESKIAEYHNAPSGLIFNSGYDANLGLFSSLPLHTDTVFYDENVHASIRDGIRLSNAKNYSFRHNDANHLKEMLRFAKGNIYVALESVYSMDGDIAPLKDIVEICQNFDANIIVDEAHATGVIGEKGKGLVCSLGLEDKIFARVHTFGKALGAHGAIVLGSENLRNYLINFSRPFIYTTALPPHSIVSILCSYILLNESEDLINKLHNRIRYFDSLAKATGLMINTNPTPIQSVIIEGNEKVKQVSNEFISKGFDVRPILSPTVAAGKERIRVCLHAFNTEEEISLLVKNLSC